VSGTRFRSGMLRFPDLTQLDLTGPYEVLVRLREAKALLLWDPVRSGQPRSLELLRQFQSVERDCRQAVV
jgi:hypothetical protein